MSNWEEIYLNFDSESIAQLLSKVKGVIVGFNVNADKIIEITPEELNQVLSKSEYTMELLKDRDIEVINNIEDFFFFLIQSIKEGKADEKLLFNKKIHQWIENTFSVKHTVIGGQAGIMANLLKKIGVKQVLLSLPSFDESLLKLLEPSLQVIIEENETYIKKPVKDIKGDEFNTTLHYVFEFKPGLYHIYDKIIECNRSNRFIVSYDFLNSKLEIDKGFYKYSQENIQNYSLAILSGFHLINPNIEPTKTYLDTISPVSELIMKWKESNPDLFIHFEIASTKAIQLKQLIIDKIIPSMDSIGLNEQELLDLLQIIDSTTYSLLREDLSAINLFKGILCILRIFPHLRIHLHYLGFYLVLSSPITEPQIHRRRNSLILASHNAAKKAEKGEIESYDILLASDYLVSNEGIKQLIALENYLDKEFQVKSNFSQNGFFNTPNFTLVGIPSIVVETPKHVVGLGDTISLISILFDHSEI